MKAFSLLFVFNLLLSQTYAQHTFSIVAVDPATGEVGSAGATCLTSADCGGCGGAVIISDLVPGIGAINAQATVCIPNSNLNIGINRMKQGDTAQEILDFLINNDACIFGNTTNRQYGIARLIEATNDSEAVGYTGSNALDAANHLASDQYAIQGNILIANHVLDSMEARFLRAEGSLAIRLMEALQGANIPGADSRCLNDGISSKSSFLRVAKPDDPENAFYLDLIVEATLPGVDPIDSLQSLFDASGVILSSTVPHRLNVQLYPNPANNYLMVQMDAKDWQAGMNFRLLTTDGKSILATPLSSPTTNIPLVNQLTDGVYIYQILSRTKAFVTLGKLIVHK